MKYSAAGDDSRKGVTFADVPSGQERSPLVKGRGASDIPAVDAVAVPIDHTDVEDYSGCFCMPEAEVCQPDVFFDIKKGWLQHWNPWINFNQLAIRTRYSGFFAFDAFRALAFLWVSNDHLIEGLGQAFTGITSWSKSNSAFRSFTALPYQGVTVFFCISGFLNIYVALRLAKFFKVSIFFPLCIICGVDIVRIYFTNLVSSAKYPYQFVTLYRMIYFVIRPARPCFI